MEIDKFRRRALCKTPRSNSLALYRVYEQCGQAGAEGGRGVDDISAGLSSSIVKNAILQSNKGSQCRRTRKKYSRSGRNLLNDACFVRLKKETGKNVIRPGIAGSYGRIRRSPVRNGKRKRRKYGYREKELDGFTYTSNLPTATAVLQTVI